MYSESNPDVEGSCPCCAGLASLARVPNTDRHEESHVGATVSHGFNTIWKLVIIHLRSLVDPV